MTSEARSAATTIVSWGVRVLMVIFLLSGCAVAVSVRLPWVKPGPAVVAYQAVVALTSIWLLYRIWRIRLRLDDHGVTVHKFMRTYRFGWREVSHFADGKVWSGGEAECWALNIVLRDGRVVTAGATIGWKESASPGVLAAIRQAAAYYQLPAELTGSVA